MVKLCSQRVTPLKAHVQDHMIAVEGDPYDLVETGLWHWNLVFGCEDDKILQTGCGACQQLGMLLGLGLCHVGIRRVEVADEKGVDSLVQVVIVWVRKCQLHNFAGQGGCDKWHQI